METSKENLYNDAGFKGLKRMPHPQSFPLTAMYHFLIIDLLECSKQIPGLPEIFPMGIRRVVGQRPVHKFTRKI